MQGVYVKATGSDSLLGQLGHVLDEVPAEKPLEILPKPEKTQANGNKSLSPAPVENPQNGTLSKPRA